MTDDEWDDWDTIGAFENEASRAVPAAIVIFFLAVLCIFVYISSETDNCAELAKKNGMVTHEYTLAGGCKVGPKP